VSISLHESIKGSRRLPVDALAERVIIVVFAANLVEQRAMRGISTSAFSMAVDEQ